MAEKSFNEKPIGGQAMSKIKVTFPKKKCIRCAYWITFLKKKWIPDDCNPAYPGCPVHSFEIDWQFPIKAAAIQLKRFQIEGNNKAIKEFIEKTPSKFVAQIMEVVAELSEEDVEVVEIIDEDEGDEKIDLDNYDHAGLLKFIMENDLMDRIPNCTTMDEDDLREELQRLADQAEAEAEDEDEDDEDDGSAVVGKISPMDEEDD